jgi:hypothetical protein
VTKDTPPRTEVAWEPIAEGIILGLDAEEFKLNLNDVVELAHDMEEARMLARGYDKVEGPVISLEDKWIIKVGGNDFRIASTFIEARSKYEGVWVCLQDNEGQEVILPSEQLITAYRPV